MHDSLSVPRSYPFPRNIHLIQTFTLFQCCSSEYLGCAYINTALVTNGGQCVGASHSQPTCGRAIDGLAGGGTTDNEWIHVAGGVGIWVKIQFARPYLINSIRVKQRPKVVEQSKGLKLTFMDGSEAYVSNASVYYIYVLQRLGLKYDSNKQSVTYFKYFVITCTAPRSNFIENEPAR